MPKTEKSAPGGISKREAAEAALEAPVVVEVRDVEKTFRIPDHRVDSIKERAVHPFRKQNYRELKALDGISFDVHQGEFFGIVGLNGSGKSTLLKILGSIYRADGGSIRVAGRIAPFIELGVGFNPEMTAYENVVLNAVMLGLSRSEAEARVQSAIEFAGLEEFADLKLKNYSSGMMVRLAFSVMVEAQADIMLVDEVLAVGDAAFQQKCEDVFHDLRAAGKTIILVTHDMNSIEKFCHRAMMIHDGKVSILGTPEEVSEWYMRANFVDRDWKPGFHPGSAEEGDDAYVVDSWIEVPGGGRVENVQEGTAFTINTVVEGIREMPDPVLTFGVADENGVHVFYYEGRLSEAGVPTLAPGERVQVTATVDNLLSPGRYYLSTRGFRDGSTKDMRMQAVRITDFVVFGTAVGAGMVSLVSDVEVTRPGTDPEA
ncbi:MAG: ABC transporter ATP-binding protein [Solirubrobacterales bacterium]|nr:ABC transporter ATP-binding protein [Solirubrobacterales bacterium]